MVTSRRVSAQMDERGRGRGRGRERETDDVDIDIQVRKKERERESFPLDEPKRTTVQTRLTDLLPDNTSSL
jgi:hypothetical protein